MRHINSIFAVKKIITASFAVKNIIMITSSSSLVFLCFCLYYCLFVFLFVFLFLFVFFVVCILVCILCLYSLFVFLFVFFVCRAASALRPRHGLAKLSCPGIYAGRVPCHIWNWSRRRIFLKIATRHAKRTSGPSRTSYPDLLMGEFGWCSSGKTLLQ